jgi:hypothetical protein
VKYEDFITPPCSCGPCRQARVDHLEGRRDPATRAILHGYDLKRWYEARERYQQAMAALKVKGM